jgi:membrane protein
VCRVDEPAEVTESSPGVVARVRQLVEQVRGVVQHTFLWRIWERMLETEFVDRSIALAGKAFVSFFPLVIVVAAFVPARSRAAIFATMTSKLGISGESLNLVQGALNSSEDVKRATGILGLVTTVFFATSFTTAIQRVYLRAWRRPPGLKVAAYTRGLLWLLAMLLQMTLTGAIGRTLGHGIGLPLVVVGIVVLQVGWWWFTAWYLLLGHVRWRPLLPGALISTVLMLGYSVSASIWMPDIVTRNQEQFGFFGVALALITWISGVAVCLLVGACAGPVLAEDPGPLGRLVRGPSGEVLTPGAPLSLGPPMRELRLRDAFTSGSDEDTLPPR